MVTINIIIFKNVSISVTKNMVTKNFEVLKNMRPYMVLILLLVNFIMIYGLN